jgi:hypothetical protein
MHSPRQRIGHRVDAGGPARLPPLPSSGAADNDRLSSSNALSKLSAREAREQADRALREKVGRTAHGSWNHRVGRSDPKATLQATDIDRVALDIYIGAYFEPAAESYFNYTTRDGTEAADTEAKSADAARGIARLMKSGEPPMPRRRSSAPHSCPRRSARPPSRLRKRSKRLMGIPSARSQSNEVDGMSIAHSPRPMLFTAGRAAGRIDQFGRPACER